MHIFENLSPTNQLSLISIIFRTALANLRGHSDTVKAKSRAVETSFRKASRLCIKSIIQHAILLGVYSPRVRVQDDLATAIRQPPAVQTPVGGAILRRPVSHRLERRGQRRLVAWRRLPTAKRPLAVLSTRMRRMRRVYRPHAPYGQVGAAENQEDLFTRRRKTRSSADDLAAGRR